MTYASSTVDTYKQQIEANKKKNQEYVNKIKALGTEEAQIKAEVVELNTEIGALTTNIEDLKVKIEDKKTVIQQTQDELAVAKDDESKQYDAAKYHIKYMYENSRESYIKKLLEAESITDLYKRFEYMKAMVSYDKEMFNKLEAVREDIEVKESNLQKDLVSLNTYSEDLNAQLSSLDNRRVLKTSKLNELGKLKTQYENEKEDLTDANKELEKKLKAELAKFAAQQYAGGEMAWPVPGYYRLSSPFGWRNDPFTGERWYHYGIDIPAPKGTNVVAANSGTVITAGWIRGYGNTVIIAHGGGVVTLYGHNSALVVKKGDVVSRGQTIAKVGSTGRSTGNHSHFEVRVNQKYQNPINYVKSNN